MLCVCVLSLRYLVSNQQPYETNPFDSKTRKMSKPWIFVSPSSRGLGHALTRHLLQTTSLPILATARSDTERVKASIMEGLRPTPPSPSPPPPPREGRRKSASSSPSESTPTSRQKEAEDVASRLHVVELDVTDERTVAAAAARAEALFPREANHLHLGFALPGILRPERSPAQVVYGGALETLRVNVLGPLLLMKHFGDFLPRKSTDMGMGADVNAETGGGGGDLNNVSYVYDASSLPPSTTATSSSSEEGGEGEEEDGAAGSSTSVGASDSASLPPEGEKKKRLLPRHATFLTASARLGSVSENRLGGWYSYRASKAGVNSLAKTFDLHLRSRTATDTTRSNGEDTIANAIAIAYHPGTVRTGLSREFWGSVPREKLFSPEFAAARLVDVVLTRWPEHGGRCWDWRGEEVPP